MLNPRKKVVIIGAGILGASVAYHLAKQGVGVTIVEKDQPASGATGSAFGWITSAVADDAPDVMLRRAAVTDWMNLEQHIPELAIQWKGSLKYAKPLSQKLPDEIILAQTEISQLVPAMSTPPLIGYYTQMDGAIDAKEATLTLLDKACELGARLKTQTTVTHLLKREGGKLGVCTSHETLDADCIILTCGVAIPSLTEKMNIQIPVLASPAILLKFSVPSPVVNTIVSGDDLEVRHTRNGDLFAAEDYLTTKNVQEIANEAQISIQKRLKGTVSISLKHSSVGQRPIPEDGVPILGFLDDQEDIYIAVMHPAVTCAATIGKLVSEEIIDGLNHKIPDSYRPSRFKG
ncbi:FAD-dependent oxidoreductase [Acinetobacter sp. ANC 4558]|uniref:NAD(P)/FAD-dependent oxidoreductase n=1 Tax=Acinetobacter sp. ANC 4558 TaxID=1977876 RepID=UPI000A343B81|nr:FAD-dependent oxidoreductase [Acinetobacter sp. ANC 4558]OTG87787.1 FAD-dependent oxidoreductase [Acinetobacter sp. ANC 4558]